MRSVFAFAFALAASTLMACAGSKSGTEPSPGGPPPSSVVLPPVFAFPGKGEVPVGYVFSEGDEIVIEIRYLTIPGSNFIAFVLVRDGDGETAVVLCSKGSSTASSSHMGSTRLKFQDYPGSSFKFYTWAKGHILNGVMLQADLEDPNEAWRTNGCYFLNNPNLSYIGPVRFDKADKRIDYELNWGVK